MKTRKYILSGIAAVLLLGLLRLINPYIPHKIKVLDCEGTYHLSLFGRKYEGYAKHNAEMDVARCLCEKYNQSKDKRYEKEIRRIARENEMPLADTNFLIDSICNRRDALFFYWYYE